MNTTDFEIIRLQILKAYKACSDSLSDDWTFYDYVNFFSFYISRYFEVFGKDHPHMRTQTIKQIIMALPEAYDIYGRPIYFDPDDYPEIIDSYFSTDFGDLCNHAMPHFISGRIREMRCYDLSLI